MNFASMLLALVAVIALAWGVLRLMRSRMQPKARNGGQDDALRFVRALPVGAKERVVIVEHRGQRWMLGVTAGSISAIAHWADTAEPNAALRGEVAAGGAVPDIRASTNWGRT